jgi:hypothetical protein
MSQKDLSKGSGRRKTDVPMEQADNNYETIFGKRKPKEPYVYKPITTYDRDMAEDLALADALKLCKDE